jgi:ribosomal-protein-alanine N-acetyltransferase
MEPDELSLITAMSMKMLSPAVVQIRQLAWEKSDLDQIMQIEWASFNQYDAYSLGDFERWLHYTPDLCLGVAVDSRLGGYVISRALRGYADLASLAIAPEFRQHGLGAALMQATEQKVKDHSLGEIHLEVRKANLAGLAFWAKMGFIAVGTLARFYGDGEDAIQMMKKLPSLLPGI